jgi:hypothetical protein
MPHRSLSCTAQLQALLISTFTGVDKNCSSVMYASTRTGCCASGCYWAVIVPRPLVLFRLAVQMSQIVYLVCGIPSKCTTCYGTLPG